MAVGANLSYKNWGGLCKKFRYLMNMRATGKASFVHRKICQKAGVPASNTVGDNPNALHDICIDTTNNNVYQCTLYSADASATTWLKINA